MNGEAPLHVDDETLLRLACNEVDAAERAGVLAHLDECEDCRTVWQAVEQVQQAALELDPGAIAPADARFNQRRETRPEPWLSYGRGWLGLAAAIVLAAGLFFFLDSRSGPVDDVDPVVRSGVRTSPEALAPAEAARVSDPRFSWNRVEAAVGYEVELLDDQGQVLWASGRLSGTSADWPDAVENRPGTYYWRVTAYFEIGEAPVASPLVSFELVASE